MAKNRAQFVCSNCGNISAKWAGQCPECGEWNTYEEQTLFHDGGDKRKAVENIKIKKITDVESTVEERIVTIFSEFNRVMGGGIVTDSVNLLAGEPGSGKSSLVTAICGELSKSHVVLYVSGEESETQIKKRLDRVYGEPGDNFYILTEPSINILEDMVEKLNPDLIIVDSIQTTYVEDIPNSVGSPTQVKESTNRLIRIAKGRPKKCAIIIIGQLIKTDNQIAGPMTLRHIVDATVMIENNLSEQLKILKTTKNRFGELEIGLFEMTDKGMQDISDPSIYLSINRDRSVSGTAVSVSQNATRNILIEIESLVSNSYFGFPSRKGVGIRKEIVDIITEILEQRAGLKFDTKNVTVMTTGGFKVSETSVDLAVAASIISSYLDIPIAEKIAFIGELGLTGEIKKVIGIEGRVKELDRLGYNEVYVPSGCRDFIKNKNIKITEIRHIKDILKIFNKETMWSSDTKKSKSTSAEVPTW